MNLGNSGLEMFLPQKSPSKIYTIIRNVVFHLIAHSVNIKLVLQGQ